MTKSFATTCLVTICLGDESARDQLSGDQTSWDAKSSNVLPRKGRTRTNDTAQLLHYLQKDQLCRNLRELFCKRSFEKASNLQQERLRSSVMMKDLLFRKRLRKSSTKLFVHVPNTTRDDVSRGCHDHLMASIMDLPALEAELFTDFIFQICCTACQTT